MIIKIGISNCWEALKEIFSVLSYQGETNQNVPELPSYMTQNGLTQKLTRKHLLTRMWRKGNTPILLVRLQTSTTTLEINLDFSEFFFNCEKSDPWHKPFSWFVLFFYLYEKLIYQLLYINNFIIKKLLLFKITEVYYLNLLLFLSFLTVRLYHICGKWWDSYIKIYVPSYFFWGLVRFVKFAYNKVCSS